MCDKVSYPTEKDARTAINHIKKQIQEKGYQREPISVHLVDHDT